MRIPRSRRRHRVAGRVASHGAALLHAGEPGRFFPVSAATAGISAGMASATRGSLDAPSRGSLDAPSRGSLDAPSLAAPTTPGYRRARPGLGPGFVLATPAPSVDVGATFTTQGFAATLSDGTGLAAGFAATQAELPPWLRRLATGTQAGGDAIFDAPANTLASKPARRHVGVESSIGIGSARFGVDFLPFSSLSSASAAGATRWSRWRSGVEGSSANARPLENARYLSCVGTARVNSLTCAPRRRRRFSTRSSRSRARAAVAAALLTSILDAALAADDAFQCSDRRGDGGKRTRADVPSTTHGPVDDGVRDAFAAGPLRRDVRAAVSALLPAASSDPSLAAVGARDSRGGPRRVDFQLRGDSRGGDNIGSPRRRRRRVGIPRVARARRSRGIGAGGTNARIDTRRRETKTNRRRRRRRARRGKAFKRRGRRRRRFFFVRDGVASRGSGESTPRVGRRRILASVPGGRVGERFPDAIGGGGAARRRLSNREGRVRRITRRRARGERFPRLRPVSNVCGAANAFDAANASATGRRCFTTSRTPSHRRGRWNPCLAAATETGVTKSSRRTIASSRDRPWAAGSSRRRCAR